MHGHTQLHSWLQDCTIKKDAAAGRHIHSLLVGFNLDISAVLGDKLIRFFSSVGSLLEASLAFCKIKYPNVFTWHSIISAHALHGQYNEALKLCSEMCNLGVQPNKFIFPHVLKSCGCLGMVQYGMLMHEVIIEDAIEAEVVVGSSLVDMYVKLMLVDEAQGVFDRLQTRNVVSWAAIIDGHAQYGDGLVALDLYNRMCQGPLEPDEVVLLCVLKACSRIGAIRDGLLIHDQIVKANFESDVILGNTLVDMYAKCGDLDGARKLFDNLSNRSIVSWGAIITGYAQNGQGELALELYEEMEERASLNEIILPCVLKSCGNVGNLVLGKKIHDKMVKCRMEYDVVIGSTLVDMYAKCASLEEAQEVFGQLQIRNVVSWGAMIGGYMQEGRGLLAIEFFKRMQVEGVKPDRVIFMYVLKACASIGALKLGKVVHYLVIQSGLNMSMTILGALVHMYAKCGSTGEAYDCLDESPKQNEVLWGALIAGYAQSGNWKLAEQSVKDMRREGVEPNSTVFTSVLSACSHAGEAEEGHNFFRSMMVQNSLTLTFEHLTCMIDLFGSTGQLKEAAQLLETLPVAANVTGWTSLMTACKTYGNVHLGQECFGEVTKRDPQGPGFVLLSSMYANAHMWEDLGQAQENLGRSWKKPGIAWIEASSKVEEFKVGDMTHEESLWIYDNLKRLNRVLKHEGYVPTSEGVAHHMHTESQKSFNKSSCSLKL